MHQYRLSDCNAVYNAMDLTLKGSAEGVDGEELRGCVISVIRRTDKTRDHMSLRALAYRSNTGIQN